MEKWVRLHLDNFTEPELINENLKETDLAQLKTILTIKLSYSKIERIAKECNESLVSGFEVPRCQDVFGRTLLLVGKTGWASFKDLLLSRSTSFCHRIKTPTIYSVGSTL